MAGTGGGAPLYPIASATRGTTTVQQQRNIEVGGATLDCTLYGSGTPVVLLANAGCSTGYFDDLARELAAGGLQAICINMRGTGESRGALDGLTVHDLAADVAGVLDALACGPAHLVGHAFGNRIARCLAVDRPALVRSVTLLAAGGLIGPTTPLGMPFRNATDVTMNGRDCVTVLGARWLSPASDPTILAQVECWPAVHLAHLATSRGMALDDWWGAGTAPLLVIQGLDDVAAPPGNGHALRAQFGDRVQLIDLPRAGHFMLLEQPDAVARAVAAFVGAGAVDDTAIETAWKYAETTEIEDRAAALLGKAQEAQDIADLHRESHELRDRPLGGRAAREGTRYDERYGRRDGARARRE